MRKDCRWLQITNLLSGSYVERARRGTATGGMIVKGPKKDHRTKTHQKRLKMTTWPASSSETVSADASSTAMLHRQIVAWAKMV